MTIEFVESNYMEALLRAALLLGDLHRTSPVHEITISAFRIRNSGRCLYPRCRIIVQGNPASYPAATVIPTPCGEDYLILYPAY